MTTPDLTKIRPTGRRWTELEYPLIERPKVVLFKGYWCEYEEAENGKD